MLYGHIELGVVVNYVTRHPLDRFHFSAQIDIGTFELFRMVGDLTGPLTDSKNLLVRLNEDIGASFIFHNWMNSQMEVYRSFGDPVERDAHSYQAQATLEGWFSTGSLDHQMFLGVEYQEGGVDDLSIVFDSYTLVDASVVYERGKWRAGLHLKNILDELYFNGSIPQNGFSATASISRSL